MKSIPISLFAVLVLNSCNSTIDNDVNAQGSDTNLIQNHALSDPASSGNERSQKELERINASNEAMIDYENGERLAKAYISMSDSSILAGGNINSDYRIFGYRQPDIHSKKMILISVFTTDVKDNPFQCPYGAAYTLSDMDSIKLKYIAGGAAFNKVSVIVDKRPADTIFIEKRWTEFADL